MTVIHRLSKIFQPVVAVAKNTNLTYKNVTSRSQRLMLELGLIHQAHPGCFHFLPLALKSIDKLINIVDNEMQRIGGQKLIFPTLVKSELWKQSGRLNNMTSELITLQDRHKHDYILAPTHEETASQLISTLAPISYKQFPLLIYQITQKFRDEMKPRFGLIRSKEFLMKDMYSFDLDEECAKNTYETINESYNRIFNRIGVKFVKVLGNVGDMGGTISHEYHFLTDKGDDKIITCNDCNYSANMELLNEQKCPNCGKDGDSCRLDTGIEVAHTFLLQDKYSKPLNAIYQDIQSKPQTLQMGCYGIGISRIIAAALECLSSDTELRWPDSLAPYNVVIIPPKKGSKQEHLIGNLPDKLYNTLEQHLPILKNNILLDDRTSLTIGRRYLDARRIGYRYSIILNEKSLENPALFEFIDIVNEQQQQQLHLNTDDIIKYIRDNTKL